MTASEPARSRWRRMPTWRRSAQRRPNPNDRLVDRQEHDWVSWRVPGPSWHVPALGLVVLVLMVGGALWFTLDWLEGVAAVKTDPNAAIGGKDFVTAKLDTVKIALSAVAGGVALFALYLAVRRQMTAERDLRARLHAQAHTEDDARARRVTELFTKAADQLGSEKAPVRLAGLYALERLGQDNPDQRPTIASLWCAYLRMPYTPPPPSAAKSSAGVFRPLQRNPKGRSGIRRPNPGATVSSGPRIEHAEAVLERDVRLSVQRLLSKHLRPTSGASSQLSLDYWPEIPELDLTDATLIDFDLRHCHLPTLRMNRVSFTGEALFADATFTGDALFAGATFSDNVVFEGTVFTGEAVFDNAIVGGEARFDKATFTGCAAFTAATFTGTAAFSTVIFTGGAAFNAATFISTAWFAGATFTGDAMFDKATFTGSAVLRNITFTGTATFHHATFADLAVFSRTTFTSIVFEGATFSDDARFEGATFSDDAVFDYAVFEPTARCHRARARLGDAELSPVYVWPRGWTLDSGDPQKDGDGLWGWLVPIPEVLDPSSSWTDWLEGEGELIEPVSKDVDRATVAFEDATHE